MKVSSHIRRRCALIIIAMIVVVFSSSFAIVWMQQQISRTAQNSKQIEAELGEMIRKIDYLDERIASIHQPVVLQTRVSSMLRPSQENQIVWVEEREMPTGRAYAVSEPYEVSLDLAMLDLQR